MEIQRRASDVICPNCGAKLSERDRASGIASGTVQILQEGALPIYQAIDWYICHKCNTDFYVPLRLRKESE